jgi:putative hydroxymethylpyrimidine transport system substrate-binding protein
MKIGSLIVAIAAAAALLAGCGGGAREAGADKGSPDPPEEVRVTLDGIEGAENVGILMALHRGYFKDVGLNVWVGSPIEPNRPVSYVAKGTDDLGVAQQPQVAIAREKGMPIVAVGSVISQPTAAMIWLKDAGIHRLEDLEGKTIAVPGIPYQERFLGAILARAGLKPADVKVRRVGYGLVGALLSGRADAIFGGSANLEGVKLEARGAEPVITPVQHLGIPAYEELVVIARSDLAAGDPRLIRSFMSAVARGTAAATEDPKGAVDAIVEALEANPPPSRKVLEAQVKATLPLLSRSG